MAKKLILLLLLIPIIVMVCLFAATKTISNLVDVPVSGVEIIDTDSHLYLNLDESDPSYSIDYAVYPTTAKNKAVSVSAEPIDGAKFAKLDFEVSDGKVKITPKGDGSAKVFITTVEGGFKDSVIVNVESAALKSINCTTQKSSLAIGESTVIYCEFTPSIPSNPLVYYKSSDKTVATVDDNGVVRAVGKGSVTITATSDYNSSITHSLTLTVYNPNALGAVTDEVVMKSDGSIYLDVHEDNVSEFDSSKLTYKVFSEDGKIIDESVIKILPATAVDAEKGKYCLQYLFNDPSFVGKFTVKIEYNNDGVSFNTSCTIEKVSEIKVEFINPAEFGLVAGQSNVQVGFKITPADVNASLSVSVSNDNVKAKTLGTIIVVDGLKAGISTLTIKVTDDENTGRTAEASIPLVIKPKIINVEESANTYGIEDLYTLGKFEYSASGELVSTSETNNKFSLHYVTNSVIGDGFAENFTWKSSVPDVYIDKSGNVSFANDTFVGNVEFEGIFSYGDVSASTGKYTVRCVSNGVNVYSYKDLYNGAKQQRVLVLQKSIKEDFGYIDGVQQSRDAFTKMHTTYDDTYYRNTNSYDAAYVTILIEFRNNVYGNGNVINAHNIAYGLDDSDSLKADAIFRGPLDFVTLNESAGSISVKGQDNICFAVYENVTINNVELRGCDLKSDSQGNQDLLDLSFTGTTVEIFGTNTNIEFSRLTNGRTVLRAFGYDYLEGSDAKGNPINQNADKKIYVNIKNSVLSGAREFIMRIGSNCFIDGEYDKNDPSKHSPNLEGDSGNEYNTKTGYASLSNEEKKAYDEKFIKTFITVKNSVFKDAGLFAVGIDSHFSGTALANGTQMVQDLGSLGELFKNKNTGGTLIDSWQNLAKTSYGAKLTFEGEVELFSWKDINNVDSSTLMSVPEGSVFEGKIDFDVKTMITELSNADGAHPNAKHPDMICKEGGKSYVHAGIVFFGGGKNYGIFDNSQTTSSYHLSQYEINLRDINRDYFRYAAGDESFYFFMYNSKSGFGYSDQEKKLSDGGDGYNCIYKK